MTATTPYARAPIHPSEPAPPVPQDPRSRPSASGPLTEQQTCFVIGPIGDRHAEVGTDARQAYERSLLVFEKVIHPACARFGIEPVRSDQMSHPGEITEQICRQLLGADLVIADVSGGNPNVMYELGLRHMTGHPVIHLGEFDQLPFDIASIRTIRFERSRSGLVEARDELIATLGRVLSDGFSVLTPVRILRGMDVPVGAAPSQSGSGPADPAAPGEDAPGLMERFAELEPDLEAMSRDMTAMTTLITTIAEVTEQFGSDMQRVAGDGSPMSAQLAVTRRLAAALSAPAAELKASACRFTDRMAGIDSTVHAALDMFEKVPPTLWGPDDRGFLTQVVDISAAARGGVETLALFGTILDVMIAMHRELRSPARDIATAVSRLSETMAKVGAWDNRARSLAA